MADAFSLMQDDEKNVQNMRGLGRAFARMSPNQLKIMSALLLNETRTRRNGFSFMQKVYVRIGGHAGHDFLNNFVSAYVLDADRERVRLISETSKTAITVLNDKDGSTVYTVDGFRPIRDKIIEGKLFRDPSTVMQTKRNTEVEDLDSAAESGVLEQPPALRRKIKVIPKDDLITLVSKLSRGLMNDHGDDHPERKRSKRRRNGQDETIVFGRR